MIWVKPLPDTVEEIAFFEALLPKIIDEAMEKDREEKEKKAREATERQRQHNEHLARPRVAERTFDSYSDLISRYVNEELGGRKLSDLRPLHIQKLYVEMQERGLMERP